MLDVTDNIVAGEVVPPPDVVRHDGDDPYLVVAADKGTATFSDIANEISPLVRVLAGRRVRLRRLGRLRPQEDGHHRPGRLGVGQAALPRAAAWTPRARTSPWSASATCPATCSATGCCCPSTSGWSPRSTTGTSSSTRTRTAATSFVERRRLFDAAPLVVGRLRPRRCISAGGGVWPRTAKSIPISAADARGARHRRRRSTALAADRADAGDPAGAGRPAVERRHRHLRQGHHRRPTPTSATRPTTRSGSTARSCGPRWSARAATSG